MYVGRTVFAQVMEHLFGSQNRRESGRPGHDRDSAEDDGTLDHRSRVEWRF